MLFSSKLQDNTDSTKKKKKKKSKKKNKTPENFTLFDKKKCIFSESPDKDKTNFCDIWTFSQNIAKDMIDYSIKSVLKPEEGFKIEKFELVIDNSVIKSRDPTPRKSLNSIEIKLKETIDLIPLKEKEHRAVEHVEHSKLLYSYL